MTTRRDALKLLTGIATASLLPLPVLAESTPKKSLNFRYCLNTSTISGQKPGLLPSIEIAARAGYQGVELWVREVKEYLDAGHTAASLKKYLDDAQIKVENAIGFAPWMQEDDALRAVGMRQMENEMLMMASIGCTRIAAPAAGVSGEPPLDLLKAGQWYKELIELGRKTGVMPQLEFWGASKALYHLGQTLMIAAAANDPEVRILADVYHLYRGGSGFEGLKMLNGQMIEVFHMNDYVASIPREQQKDKDRVYPGDGAAPMTQILTDLTRMGGTKVLSLELFNETYWKQDALTVAKTGLQKMQALTAAVNL